MALPTPKPDLARTSMLKPGREETPNARFDIPCRRWVRFFKLPNRQQPVPSDTSVLPGPLPATSRGMASFFQIARFGLIGPTNDASIPHPEMGSFFRPPHCADARKLSLY